VVEQQPRLVYIHEKALFDTLLSAPERMGHELVRLCEKGARFALNPDRVGGNLKLPAAISAPA
jgi:hypothetical protein